MRVLYRASASSPHFDTSVSAPVNLHRPQTEPAQNRGSTNAESDVIFLEVMIM